MTYDTDGPAEIAAALAAELQHKPSYLPIPAGGATRAAALIAPLIA